MRAKVREGYSFIREKGNLHIPAGVVIEDLTSSEVEGQAWKLDFLKDTSKAFEASVEEKEKAEEKEEEEVQVTEVSEERKAEIKEEVEAETKDVKAAPADRSIKRAKRK